MVLALLLSACISSVLADYQRSKDEVLGALEPLGEDWKPELRVRLSEDLVESAVRALLEHGLLEGDRTIAVTGPFGVSARLTPKIAVKKLVLGPAKECEACVGVEASLDGNAAFDLAGYGGSVPMHAELAADVEIGLVRSGEGWSASASLDRVRSLEVDVPRAGKLELSKEAEHWAKSALKAAPAIPLGTFGGGDLPLRAARIRWVGESAEIGCATELFGAVPVATGADVKSGWAVSLDADTVLALARRAAFEKGPLSHDVAIDPRALRFEEGGGFVLDLRLWRLAGAGWWRDYTVRGSLAIKDGKLVVRSDEVVEAGKSRSAGIVDPLALLVEGRILQSLSDAFDRAIPLRTSSIAGLDPRPAHISVEGSRVTLEGTVGP